MINEAENKKHKEDKDTKHKKNNKSKVIINEENDDEQNEDDNSKGVSKEVANLKEVGVMSVAKADDRIQVIPIIGQVEGHNISGNQTKSTKYELIIPQLIAIERDSNVKGILIVLNTAGGDVEAGLAIAEMITGFVIGVPQTFEYFRKMQERIVEFVVRTSKIDSDDFRRLMSQTDELLNDIGTILIGDQAVECGLIDEVGGIREALDKLEELISEGEKNQLEISSEENISEEIDKI